MNIDWLRSVFLLVVPYSCPDHFPKFPSHSLNSKLWSASSIFFHPEFPSLSKSHQMERTKTNLLFLLVFSYLLFIPLCGGGRLPLRFHSLKQTTKTNSHYIVDWIGCTTRRSIWGPVLPHILVNDSPIKINIRIINAKPFQLYYPKFHHFPFMLFLLILMRKLYESYF